MKPRLLLSLSLLLLQPIFALQANLAGVVDWHTPLLGVPLLDSFSSGVRRSGSPTPPTLVDTPDGLRGVVISRGNVLGVVDQKGEIVWRQRLEDGDEVGSYHVVGDSILLLSGPGGDTARLFTLSSGRPLWETHLSLVQNPELTNPPNPINHGSDVSFTSDLTSVVILSNGRRVTKLDLTTGRILWSLEAPGAGDTIIFQHVRISGPTVHLLAYVSSFSSGTLATMSLSLETSIPLAEMGQIPSIVELPEQSLLSSGAKEGEVRVVWTEHGRVRSVELNEDGSIGKVKDMLPGAGRLFTRVLDVGKTAKDRGLLLAQMRNGGVQIVDVIKGKTVDEFEGSVDAGDHSVSTYSAVKTDKGIAFHRLYWSFNLNLAMSQTYHVHDDGLVIQSGFTFGFDTLSHGVMLHAAVSSTLSQNQLPTLMITTSTGSVQLVEQRGVQWVREEGLSELTAVTFIDLGEPEVEEARHVLTEETFIARVTRHLTELKDLPSYVMKFAKRLTSSSLASSKLSPLSKETLHNDQFGFQKLVLGVTPTGKLYALDSTNGRVVWSATLGRTSEDGSELEVVGMWNVRKTGEEPPLVDVLAQVKTVVFQINALTGDAGQKDEAGLPEGKELFDGRPETAFLLPFRNCHTSALVLAIVDQTNHIHIFPSCKKVLKELYTMSSSLFFHTIDKSSIHGHAPSPHSGEETPIPAAEIWSFNVPPDETLLEVRPLSPSPTASFGKVTGDKKTLYKYLNPHLLTVTTRSESGGAVYVVDSVTGKVIYSTKVESANGHGVESVILENWLVYRWKGKDGWRIGSVELYENVTDSKGETPGISGFADKHDIVAFTQSWVLPGEISMLGFTNSKLGVTARELLFINAQGQIASIPRKLLDPRRPIEKPTSSDKEELLIPYDTYLASEPRRVITHTYPVIGLKHILTSPTLLESTSLIFAHGLDLFGSRISPGGTFDMLSDNFNKPQLLLTLAALSVGIMVARPAVRRKMERMRWY
ncbi:hypothetical protein TREMEDRAFT_69081 [Tremella mesenterica DSM 1558]|uniref:uncharacterized protein n=1 Tax=Tremella mesenterica (strain ATCC 24925 / CBS 8224 / DSM 1558 / NBRC 9311 / NRRL Y-6157 / RJB 2259-6 / UBC 559-6) TaxID=578456 RepID=UPI0003F496D1|nr:uncharacterized protein TREMEDRAFT_69081 [Tremella mesenterica DSM 1558]EIW68579.1 hypothetical protein TREMEDRAFT_69081 [Tremella mesenterica DSM 1558]